MGRPPYYKTVKQMQKVIDQYFEDCQGKPLEDDNGNVRTDKRGNPIIISRPPTVTGLALALGFTSRQALLNYQCKPEFVDAVTRAKLRIESYAEERLYDRDANRGAQFNLLYNFRWANQDKKEEDESDGSGVIVLPEVPADG